LFDYYEVLGKIVGGEEVFSAKLNAVGFFFFIQIRLL
jgi:hypothetical protein